MPTSTNIIENPIIESAQQLQQLITQHLEESSQLKKIPLLVVIGATAAGKTSLGIALANRFQGEIISADSRQVYRQMDIGSAKPTVAELAQAKHYLINYVDPDDSFTLADFQKISTQLIKQIHITGHLPILVGGTGLYINSITENYQLPDSLPDPFLRRKYEELAKEKGNTAVHQVLQTLDPESALKIHPNNLRYVIRAIEIASQTDRPKQNQKGYSTFHPLYIQIDWPRAELYRRIEKRIDQQLAAGLVEETRQLLSQYGRELPALSSLGYQEIGDYLEGEIPLEQAIETFKKNTRNFAKRQLTWFRKFTQVYSIPGAQLRSLLAELNKK